MSVSGEKIDVVAGAMPVSHRLHLQEKGKMMKLKVKIMFTCS